MELPGDPRLWIPGGSLPSDARNGEGPSGWAGGLVSFLIKASPCQAGVPDDPRPQPPRLPEARLEHVACSHEGPRPGAAGRSAVLGPRYVWGPLAGGSPGHLRVGARQLRRERGVGRPFSYDAHQAHTPSHTSATPAWPSQCDHLLGLPRLQPRGSLLAPRAGVLYLLGLGPAAGPPRMPWLGAGVPLCTLLRAPLPPHQVLSALPRWNQLDSGGCEPWGGVCRRAPQV